MRGFDERSCFSTMVCMRRAILSAPPPSPAMMTKSMGFFGSQAACAAPVTDSSRCYTVSAVGGRGLRVRNESVGSCRHSPVELVFRPGGFRRLYNHRRQVEVGTTSCSSRNLHQCSPRGRRSASAAGHRWNIAARVRSAFGVGNLGGRIREFRVPRADPPEPHGARRPPDEERMRGTGSERTVEP